MSAVPAPAILHIAAAPPAAPAPLRGRTCLQRISECVQEHFRPTTRKWAVAALCLMTVIVCAVKLTSSTSSSPPSNCYAFLHNAFYVPPYSASSTPLAREFFGCIDVRKGYCQDPISGYPAVDCVIRTAEECGFFDPITYVCRQCIQRCVRWVNYLY